MTKEKLKDVIPSVVDGDITRGIREGDDGE